MTKRALVVSLLHCTDQIGRTSLLHFCLTGASCAEVHSDRLLSPFPFDVEKGRRTVGSWVLIFPDQHGVHGIWVKDCINHDWKHFEIYGNVFLKVHILFKVPVYAAKQHYLHYPPNVLYSFTFSFHWNYKGKHHTSRWERTHVYCHIKKYKIKDLQKCHA